MVNLLKLIAHILLAPITMLFFIIVAAKYIYEEDLDYSLAFWPWGTWKAMWNEAND